MISFAGEYLHRENCGHEALGLAMRLLMVGEIKIRNTLRVPPPPGRGFAQDLELTYIPYNPICSNYMHMYFLDPGYRE